MIPKTGDTAKVDAAIAAVHKKYGDRCVNRYSEGAVQGIEVIPSGSFALDLALGVGGYPRGRVVELYGPEASGKTTLTLHAIAMAQAAGLDVAFIDAEHALDPVYAASIGVDMDSVVLSQPDYGEQALDIVVELTQSGGFGAIVIDSVAALTPKAELDGEMGQSHMGLQARMMSQALRKLTAIAHNSGTTLFFINQLRSKIGVVFGSPEVTTGGNALKYYASVRLDVRRREKVTDASGVIGNEHEIKVVKNKMAPPFRSCTVTNVYGKGFDRIADLSHTAMAAGVVEKAGSWFRLLPAGGDPVQLCQGAFNLLNILREDGEIRRRVVEEMVKKNPQLRWLP